MNILSYTKPNDERIYIGAKPTEVYSVAVLRKTTQQGMQYYIILTMQDFYHNYHLTVVDELNSVKKELGMIRNAINMHKKKNDESLRTLRL